MSLWTQLTTSSVFRETTIYVVVIIILCLHVKSETITTGAAAVDGDVFLVQKTSKHESVNRAYLHRPEYVLYIVQLYMVSQDSTNATIFCFIQY